MSINNPWENFEIKNQNEIFENEKTGTKIDVEDVLKFQEYKKDLENIIPELEKIWLKIEEDWSLNFQNLKSCNFWPKINWKNLCYFPSIIFNKKYNLWNKYWYIHSKKDLEKLFIFLWFSISENIFTDFEEEKKFYKYELEKIIPELQKIWLEINENWSLNFENLKWYQFWPKINWKSLYSFPSSNFNINYWIWDNKWKITTKKHLTKLFLFFWFKIENKIIKKINFKEDLEWIIPELQKVWLKVDKNWILDFSKVKSSIYWPKINWKNLNTFPNMVFLRKHGIVWYSWMSSAEQLAKLFEITWFQVKKED